MSTFAFEARTVGRSIDLNRLAGHFGIRHRYTWEEPLCLDETRLRGILHEPEAHAAWIFSFGAVVFTNCQAHEINDILLYLTRHEPALTPGNPAVYSDIYTLVIDPSVKPGMDSEEMTVEAFEPWQPEILATVLAKSVALERVEASLDATLDRFEERLERLEKGRLEHDSISYLGILDKPDLTWNNDAAEKFYTNLSRQFGGLVEQGRSVGGGAGKQGRVLVAVGNVPLLEMDVVVPAAQQMHLVVGIHWARSLSKEDGTTSVVRRAMNIQGLSPQQAAVLQNPELRKSVLPGKGQETAKRDQNAAVVI